MAYSGTMYVCLNENEPHFGHQWTNPVGDRVLCPGVSAADVIKASQAQVARLETELAEAQEEARLFEVLFEARCKLLEDTKRLGLCICKQRDEAQAAKAALAAAMRGLVHPGAARFDEGGKMVCWYCLAPFKVPYAKTEHKADCRWAKAEAALSPDAGAGCKTCGGDGKVCRCCLRSLVGSSNIELRLIETVPCPDCAALDTLGGT